MDSIILSGIIGTVSAAASAGVSHVLTKKKYRAEVTSTEIENLQSSIKVYREIIEDLKKRMIELQEENNDLRAQISELRSQVENISTLVTKNIIENSSKK